MLKSTLKVFIVIVPLLAFFGSGCGQTQPPNNKKNPDSAASYKKAHVRVLVGVAGLDEVKEKSGKGKTAKFKGELALVSTKGNKVVVHLAKLYSGEEAAVKASDLTKDFMTDRSAAEKKYKKANDTIIVEGTIAVIDSDELVVILAGHEK